MKISFNEIAFRTKFPRFIRYKRFTVWIQNVIIGDINECWEWTGSLDFHGYGNFAWPEKNIRLAHQAAYELFIGARRGLCVCHKCDNPPCVNPNHLFLGTNKDNSEDCVKKHRQYRGTDHWNAKLSVNEVVKIRTKYLSGTYTLKHLAEKYNVSIGTISLIIRDKIWKDPK